MILSLLCAADFMISDLSTCAWNQRGGGEENNSPLLDSNFFHSNFLAPNKSFFCFFFFVQIAAKSWRSDSWMMSKIFFPAFRIYYSCSSDIAPPPPAPVFKTPESLGKHHPRDESFCHNKYPNADSSKFPHKQHEKNARRWRKKKISPITGLLQKLWGSRNETKEAKDPGTPRHERILLQPIHSRTRFNPSESKCAPTSSPPPPLPPSW